VHSAGIQILQGGMGMRLFSVFLVIIALIGNINLYAQKKPLDITKKTDPKEKPAILYDISKGSKALELKKNDVKPETVFIKNGRQFTYKQMQDQLLQTIKAFEENNKKKSAQMQTVIPAKLTQIQPQTLSPIDLKKITELKAVSTPDDTVENPVVETISSLKVKPGDELILYGKGFGSTKGTVTYSIASLQNQSGAVLEWAPKYIRIKIADNISGLRESTGIVKVKTKTGKEASPSQFMFEPAMEVVRIDTRNWGERKVTINGTEPFAWFSPYDVDGGYGVMHYGGVAVGSSGTDYFCKGASFANGWVIDHFLYDPSITAGGEAEVKMTVGAPGATSPEINISWWTSASDGCSYWLEVFARGPRGTSYK